MFFCTNTGYKPLTIAAIAVLAICGCDRNEVKVYEVAKEKPAAADPHAGHDHGANPHTANPHAGDPHGLGGLGASATVKWVAPTQWQELPADNMRAARFTVPGQNGQTADVSIIPLRGFAAPKIELVNLWRQQIKLAVATEADLAKLVEKIPVGPESGELCDMVSEQALLDKEKVRILVAMVSRDETSWFFKVTGPDALVAATRKDFLEFVKTMEFLKTENTAPSAPPMGGGMMGGMGAGEKPAALPAWQVPAGWESQTPGQMMLAKFATPAAGGVKAEVTISALPGDGGGPLGNVNRWRGQLSLPPVDAEALNKLAGNLQVGDAQALIVDMKGTSAKTGQPARMVALSVPQGPQTWFYKLVGDEKAVESQKDSFINFVKSAKY